MSAIQKHITIPIFQKDSYSLDYEIPGGLFWNDNTWPTLEHLLWAIFAPELEILPTHAISYVRRKVRQKQGISTFIQNCMNPEKRNEFISLWK